MLDSLLLMPRLYSLVSSLSFQITKVLPRSLIHTIGKSNNNPSFWSSMLQNSTRKSLLPFGSSGSKSGKWNPRRITLIKLNSI